MFKWAFIKPLLKLLKLSQSDTSVKTVRIVCTLCGGGVKIFFGNIFHQLSPPTNKKYVFAARFHFVSQLRFNFICCRLKNCLVYQKSIFLWVKEFWSKTSKKIAWRAKNFEQFILPLEIVNASWIKQKRKKNLWEKLNEPWN